MSNATKADVMFDDVFAIRAGVGQEGVFSTQDIKQGTVINNDGFAWIIEEPVKHKSDTAEQFDKIRQNAYAKQWEAVCRQFSTSRNRLQDMIQHLHPKPKEGESMGQWLQAVLLTNGWDHFYSTATKKRQKATMLLIYKGSKYNHSCEPSLGSKVQHIQPSTTRNTNAIGQFDGDRQFWVEALVDIPAGTEVFLSYLGAEDLKVSTYSRKKILKIWGFDCKCTRCQKKVRQPQATLQPDDEDVQTRRRRFVSMGVIRNMYSNLSVDAIDKASTQKSAAGPARRPQRVAVKNQRLVYPGEDQPARTHSETTAPEFEPDNHHGLHTNKEMLTNEEMLASEDTTTELVEMDGMRMDGLAAPRAMLKVEDVPMLEAYSVHDTVPKRVAVHKKKVKSNDTNVLRKQTALLFYDFASANSFDGAEQMVDGKLMWVERQSTPQGWQIRLSPSGLYQSRCHCAHLTGNPTAAKSNEAYWDDYQAQCKANLQTQKATWTAREIMLCATQQNYYEADVMRSLASGVPIKRQKPTAAVAVSGPTQTVVAPSDTRLQQDIHNMFAWLDGICIDQAQVSQPRLSSIGVIFILCRLAYYAHTIQFGGVYSEKDSVMRRIQAYVPVFYPILRMMAERDVPGYALQDIGSRDPSKVLECITCHDLYTQIALVDFSCFLVRQDETFQESYFNNLHPIHDLSWWVEDLAVQESRIRSSLLHSDEVFTKDNYCLLCLLRQSVAPDGTLGLFVLA